VTKRQKYIEDVDLSDEEQHTADADMNSSDALMVAVAVEVYVGFKWLFEFFWKLLERYCMLVTISA
jgi:hypothetical protein